MHHQSLSSLQIDVSKPQVRTAILAAAVLFALSGLVGGFALGAFIHAHQAQSSSLADKVMAHTARSLATADANTIKVLGCPAMHTSQSRQIADGQTTYMVTVQAEDKYQNQTCNLGGKQQPLHDQGITCRLWLMLATHDPLQLPEDLIKNMQFAGPLPNGVEIASSLIFDPTTQQTQLCQQGLGTWKYTLSPSLKAGDYYLIGLTDWSGRSYNWSWATISIQNKQDQQKQKEKDNNGR